jgi:glucokinase
MPTGSECVVAVDVGGTNLKGALVDRRGRTHAQERRPTQTDAGPRAAIEAVLALGGDLARHEPRPVAVGLAVPGLVDESAGTVRNAANLHWRDVPIGPLAEQRLGVAVTISHDVRAAALAEGLLGAARDATDYLLITLGTGVGGAVVIGGRPYSGAHGIGGELGHIAVEPRGPMCACGRQGCLETFASASHIAQRYLEMTGDESDDLDAEQVSKRAAAGDPLADAVWSQALDALAIAIANYATLLDPEMVVIGGGMAADDNLFDSLRHRLRAHMRFGDPPAVVPAVLGREAGRLGAAIAAWRVAGIDESEFASWAT